MKTDVNGVRQWDQRYEGLGNDRANAVVQRSDGGYAVVGYTNSFGVGLDDAWLVKTETELALMWTDSTPNAITLYRGATDPDWNFVRVRIWTIKQP